MKEPVMNTALRRSVDDVLFETSLRLSAISASKIFLLVESADGNRRCCGDGELLEAYLKGILFSLGDETEVRLRKDERSTSSSLSDAPVVSPGDKGSSSSVVGNYQKPRPGRPRGRRENSDKSAKKRTKKGNKSSAAAAAAAADDEAVQYVTTEEDGGGDGLWRLKLFSDQATNLPLHRENPSEGGAIDLDASLNEIAQGYDFPPYIPKSMSAENVAAQQTEPARTGKPGSGGSSRDASPRTEVDDEKIDAEEEEEVVVVVDPPTRKKTLTFNDQGSDLEEETARASSSSPDSAPQAQRDAGESRVGGSVTNGDNADVLNFDAIASSLKSEIVCLDFDDCNEASDDNSFIASLATGPPVPEKRKNDDGDDDDEIRAWDVEIDADDYVDSDPDPKPSTKKRRRKNNEAAASSSTTKEFADLFELPTYSALAQEDSQQPPEDRLHRVELSDEETLASFRSDFGPSTKEDGDQRFVYPLVERGWRREVVLRAHAPTKTKRADVYYYAPSGKKCRVWSEISALLNEGDGGGLSQENFVFKQRLVGAPINETLRLANSRMSLS